MLPRDAQVLADNWDYITGQAKHVNLPPGDDNDQWLSLCIWSALAGFPSPLQMFAHLDIDARDGICYMVTCEEKTKGEASQARYCEAHLRKRNRPLGDKTMQPSWLGSVPDAGYLPFTENEGVKRLDGVSIVNLRNYEHQAESFL